MGEFLTKLFDFLKTLTGENRRGQIFLLILIFGAIGFSLWTYWRVSGMWPLGHIEKRIELLGELHTLEQAGIAQSTELAPIYNDLVDEVANYDSAILPEFLVPKPALSNLSLANIPYILIV